MWLVTSCDINFSFCRKGKIDQKYFVFGEEAEEGEENNFQGRIKQILRVTLEALLAISEVQSTLLGLLSSNG